MPLPSRESPDSADHSVNWFYGTVNQNEGEEQERPVSQDSFNVAERGQVVIAQPDVIQNYLYPITASLKTKIIEYRAIINAILNPCLQTSGDIASENPLLLITGPKYIDNPMQAKYCAQWLSALSGKRKFEIDDDDDDVSVDPVLRRIYTENRPISNKDLMISMLTNLNHLNYDYKMTYDHHPMRPSLMTYEIENGIPICRALLCELCQYCPLVGQLSDTVIPQYMSDLFCLGIVGSSLTESQLHRELVSGVSYPIGFQTDVTDPKLLEFKINSAIDAITSSSNPHHFLSITKLGVVAIVGTTGNEDTFIVLSLNNISTLEEAKLLVDKVLAKLGSKNLAPKILIDIGKVQRANYDSKYNMLESFLRKDNICAALLGFMIDSGEDYFQGSKQLTEKTSNRANANPYVTFEFNNLKKKMHKHEIHQKRDYDTFEHANKLIYKLVELAKYRKGLLRELKAKK